MRRQLALKNGGFRGGYTKAFCNKCKKEGAIYWPISITGRGGKWVHFSFLEIDHIQPESRGGKATIENLQLLCRNCNRTKGSKQ
jgi:hypothetical protein